MSLAPPTPIRLWDLGLIQITPSRQSPWRWPLARGHQFTDRQLRALQDRGIDPEACETIEVRSRATCREVWAPVDAWTGKQQLPDSLIDCPVVGRLRGLVQVITPTGKVESVQPDGRVRAPKFGRAA